MKTKTDQTIRMLGAVMGTVAGTDADVVGVSVTIIVQTEEHFTQVVGALEKALGQDAVEVEPHGLGGFVQFSLGAVWPCVQVHYIRRDDADGS